MVKLPKLRKNPKFDTKYCDVAMRLKAAGFNDENVGYALGVSGRTIQNWRNKYFPFREALEGGKEIAVRHLVASAIQGACGYDYEEIEKRANSAGELKEIITRTKHQKPDAFLLTFMLINLGGGAFRNTKYIETQDTKLSLELVGQVESEQIKRLAGKLTEIAEKKGKKEVITEEIIDTVEPIR